jgi:AAA+ ATPase superfamily predicted ATPase
MDEFSRLKEHSPDFITKFQDFWDSKLSKTKIMFIAIGSSMSMMFDIFMDKTAPLYGRMTWKIPFRPFRYVDFRGMFSEVDESKRVELFSVFGGTPHFLWFVKKHADKPLMDIIDRLVLSRTAPLKDEPNNFITMELKKETNYNSVLHAMAKTNGTREEMVVHTGIDQKDIDYYLNNLSDLLCITKKLTPVFHDKGQKTRYRFDDNFFGFWYKYIFPNWSLIELGNAEMLKSKISSDINSFTGHRFEEIIQELLVLYNGKKIKGLSIDFTEIGPWWGRNRKGETEEIDLLANDPQSRQQIVCEIKWTGSLVDSGCVSSLVEKSRLLNTAGKINYLIVSRSGFESGCIKYMDEKGIVHLDLKEMSELFDDVE